MIDGFSINDYSNKEILRIHLNSKIVDYFLKEDIGATLLVLNDILERGFDGHHFINGLAEHFRNLLVCKDVRTAALLEVTESIQERFIEQAKAWEGPVIMRALYALSQTDVNFKSSRNQRLLIEVVLMQLCSLQQEQEKKNP